MGHAAASTPATYASLLASIAKTLSDYRASEIPSLDAAHVERWIEQFDHPVRLPMLQEFNHILQNTYFSKAAMLSWLSRLSTNQKLAGPQPSTFWESATTLNLQARGTSQADMLVLLYQSVLANCGATIGRRASAVGPYIYLDDFIFTGNTAIRDLSKWIANSAPQQIDLHVIAVAVHSYGEYYLRGQLDRCAKKTGKALNLTIWRTKSFEDRRKYVDSSEVFRPTGADGDANVEAYVAHLTSLNHPPVFRGLGKMPTTGVFSSSATRDILETELLRAGARIRAGCANVKQAMRPLGFSTLDTLGFGAMVVTFRNCPNNAPLALWWGDPHAVWSPLSRWYPLLPRRQQAPTLRGPTFWIPNVAALAVDAASVTDGPDDDQMPCEAEAEAAVRHAIESLEIDADEGIALVEEQDGLAAIETIEDLREHLTTVYDEAWYAYASFDGGAAVFDSDPTNTVEDALVSVADELAKLGWTL